MLTDAERQEAVASLLKSHETKVQGERPSVMFPHIEIEDSYAISTMEAEEMQKRGLKVIGHKVGLTSKAMRASSKIDEPDYGYMFDNMLLEDGAIVQHSNFCVPRVEPELTFVLKDGLKGPNVSLVDVLNATDYVIPSIEIIDRLYPPQGLEDRFPIPVVVTQDDLDRAVAGEFVVRVVYLEEPSIAMPIPQRDGEQRSIDINGSDDPLVAADQLGRPMAIVRIGSRVPDEALGGGPGWSPPLQLLKAPEPSDSDQ